MDKILCSTLAAIPSVDGRVYPLKADETAKGTYIVYWQVKNSPLSTLDDSVKCSIVDYEIHILSNVYGDCQETASAAAAASRSMAGVVQGGVFIQSVNVLDQSALEWVPDLKVFASVVKISCFVSYI